MDAPNNNINILCGTWNVNAKVDLDDLTSWIRPLKDWDADIYAIGIQELTDLKLSAKLANSEYHPELWRNTIQEYLGDQFHLVGECRLVGMFIILYGRVELDIQDVMISSFGTGTSHPGNKGSVSIRFSLNEETYCFVNSHFAARKGMINARIRDYNLVKEMISFGDNLSIFHHDRIFWCGDFNWRFTCNDMSEVYDRIFSQDIDWLRAQCEYLNAQKKFGIFPDFQEGDITFLPTYKFTPGTNEYDRRPEGKNRMPAYCDRVFFHGKVDLLHYGSSDSQIMSDHKPVCACFQTN